MAIPWRAYAGYAAVSAVALAVAVQSSVADVAAASRDTTSTIDAAALLQAATGSHSTLPSSHHTGSGGGGNAGDDGFGFAMAVLLDLASSGWKLVACFNAGVVLLAGVADGLLKAFMRPISAEDWRRLKERAFNFALFNLLLISSVLEPRFTVEWSLWVAWFCVVGSLTLISFLARKQLEPVLSVAAGGMLHRLEEGRGQVTLLLITATVEVGLVFMVATALGRINLRLAALILADCVTNAITTAHTLAYYLALWYDARRGGSWERRPDTMMVIDLVGDCTVLGLTALHYVHIWLVHGLTFSLVDFVLLLSLRSVVSALLHRWQQWKLYHQLSRALDDTIPDAESAELLAEEEGAPAPQAAGGGATPVGGGAPAPRPPVYKDCSICMEPMTSAKRLPVCRHLFHRHCLRRWLLGGDDRCPLCRQGVTPEVAARLAAASTANGGGGPQRRGSRGGGGGATGGGDRVGDAATLPDAAGGGELAPDAGAGVRPRAGGAAGGGGLGGAARGMFRFGAQQFEWLPLNLPNLSVQFVTRTQTMPPLAGVDVNARGNGGGGVADAEAVTQIADMFPHLPRPAIRRHLYTVAGGNVQITVDAALAGDVAILPGDVEAPPATSATTTVAAVVPVVASVASASSGTTIAAPAPAPAPAPAAIIRPPPPTRDGAVRSGVVRYGGRDVDVDADDAEIDAEVNAIATSARMTKVPINPIAFADARKQAMLRRARRDYVRARAGMTVGGGGETCMTAAPGGAGASAAAGVDTVATSSGAPACIMPEVAGVAVTNAADGGAPPSAACTMITTPHGPAMGVDHAFAGGGGGNQSGHAGATAGAESVEEARAKRAAAARLRLTAATSTGGSGSG